MASITEALRGAVSAERLAALNAIIDQKEYAGGLETATSGALSVSKEISLLSITGTKAFTLADGTYVGQVKKIRCSVAASTPVGTITPNLMAGGLTTLYTSVAALNDSCELVWTTAGWVIAKIIGFTTTAPE